MTGFAFFIGLFLGCVLMASANYLDWKARSSALRTTEELEGRE